MLHNKFGMGHLFFIESKEEKEKGRKNGRKGGAGERREEMNMDCEVCMFRGDPILRTQD